MSSSSTENSGPKPWERLADLARHGSSFSVCVDLQKIVFISTNYTEGDNNSIELITILKQYWNEKNVVL